jgi:hypothetical protein
MGVVSGFDSGGMGVVEAELEPVPMATCSNPI